MLARSPRYGRPQASDVTAWPTRGLISDGNKKADRGRRAVVHPRAKTPDIPTLWRNGRKHPMSRYRRADLPSRPLDRPTSVATRSSTTVHP